MLHENKHVNFFLRLGYFLLITGGICLFARYGLRVTWPFLLALGMSAIIRRPVTFISQKTHIPKGPLAACFTLAFLGIGALIIYLLGSLIIYRSGDLIDALPGLIDYFQAKLLIFEASLDSLLRNMLPMLKDMPFLSLEKLLTPESAASSIDVVGILSTAGSAFFSIPDLLFTTVFIFMGTYFFTVQWSEIKGFIAHAFSPVLLEAAASLRNFLFTSVWRWVKAQMILICVTCTELCIAFLLMKQQNAIPLGMCIAVIDALPILGVGTVLIPWSLFSLLTGSFRKGLMLILTYIFILCVRNTLEPRVVGEKIGLNPFVTLLSMFIGFRLGGFFGLAFIPIAVLSILELQKLGYISLWEDHADYK